MQTFILFCSDATILNFVRLIICFSDITIISQLNLISDQKSDEQTDKQMELCPKLASKINQEFLQFHANEYKNNYFKKFLIFSSKPQKKLIFSIV